MSDLNIEKLVETVVAEVLDELNRKGVTVISSSEQKKHSCSCEIKEINPCNCKTSQLSKKYLISIRAELNDTMAL